LGSGTQLAARVPRPSGGVCAETSGCGRCPVSQMEDRPPDQEDHDDQAAEALADGMLRLTISRALTGDLLATVTMRSSDTVLDLEQKLMNCESLECLPRLLHDGKPLQGQEELAAAGLRSGDTVLAVVCPYQAVATASMDYTARLWNAATGECQRVFEGHTNYVHCVAFSPDGRNLITGSHDRTAIIWNLASGQAEKTLTGHHSYVKGVCYSFDGKVIVTASGDSTAMLWDAPTGLPRHWEVGMAGGQKAWSLQGHMSSVNSASFSPDAIRLVTGSEDCTAKVWEVESGRCVLTLKGHSSSTYACFSPTGEHIATASDDKSAKLWHALTGECLQTFEGHTKFVRSIAFSPNGRRIATSSGDTTARIWCIESGKCVQTLKGHTGFVYTAAFGPTGEMLVSGSADGSARIWSIETGTCEQVLEGHAKQVSAVSFGSQGGPRTPLPTSDA